MTSRPDVSVIIVSFNTCAMTLAAIGSVYAETRRHSFEVIVADNMSGDGSAEAIAAQFPNVILIRTGENLGFGPANNLAVRKASGQFVLLLNPDTVILDEAIDVLLDFALASPQAKVWGGRTIFADGSLNPKSCWRFMSFWSLWCEATGLARLFASSDLFNREAYGGWARDSVREVGFVSGCFLLMRRDFWNTLGGFDPQFFMYAEEADLCLRAVQAGARPQVTPDATIIHYGGASETQGLGKISRLFCGKATFLHKHRGRLYAWACIGLLRLHTLVRWSGYGVLSHMRSRPSDHASAELWRAVWQGRAIWARGYPPVPTHIPAP